MVIAGNLIAAIFCSFCALILAGCTFLGLLQFKNVYLHYKQGNHSVERAGGEAARGAARNQTVRSAVKEVATNLV